MSKTPTEWWKIFETADKGGYVSVTFGTLQEFEQSIRAESKSEVDVLLQAANEAALREVAKKFQKQAEEYGCEHGQVDPTTGVWEATELEMQYCETLETVAEDIESIIPQPSALARHDDQVIIDFVKEFGMSIRQVCPDELKKHDEKLLGECNAHIERLKKIIEHDREELRKSLYDEWGFGKTPQELFAAVARLRADSLTFERQSEQLKAEFAAVMEKMVEYIETHVWSIAENKMTEREKRESHYADAIRALIPATYADALKERIRAERLEEAEWWSPRDKKKWSENQTYRIAKLNSHR